MEFATARDLAAWPDPADLDRLPGTVVGGTLSVGGIGGASPHYGAQVDTVLELEVVTGAGRRIRCSPGRHLELFQAVLAGLGQCAVLVRATLRLLPAPSRVRHYRLGYSAPPS